MIIDPDFERLLQAFSPEILHSAHETIYALRPDLTLAYINHGWVKFASQNGGEPLNSSTWTIGRCILDAIAPNLRPFFTENFATCLSEKCPWEHRYECSSADLFRMFIMTTYPLGEAEGLLVVNSLVQELPHSRDAFAPLEELYRDENGFINQCCHCQRVKRKGNAATWDWVPDWVKVYPPNTSHGLCEPCFGFYYSPQRFHKNSFPDTIRTPWT